MRRGCFLLDPRYEWEDEMYRKGPVFAYPPEKFVAEEYDCTQGKYLEIKVRLQDELRELILKAYI